MKRSTIASILSSLVFLLLLLVLAHPAQSNPPGREYYEIRVYHLENAGQQKAIDQYLEQALLPGLHRTGIGKVGVFKPVGMDTSSAPRIIVLIPYPSLNAMEQVNDKLNKDKRYITAAAAYINAAHNEAPYKRIEKIVLKAFSGMPVMQVPKLSAPQSENIYELRSYEGATEKRYTSKLKMFNEGDEIGLFDRLGFNAVFYGEVLAGSAMPNLMYMTSFDSKASRDEHWGKFREDPQWKKISAMPEYQNTVSHSDIYLLHATAYSDL